MSAPPLSIAPDERLPSLHRALAALRKAAPGGWLLIEGEEGVGKSALCAQAIAASGAEHFLYIDLALLPRFEELWRHLRRALSLHSPGHIFATREEIERHALDVLARRHITLVLDHPHAHRDALPSWLTTLSQRVPGLTLVLLSRPLPAGELWHGFEASHHIPRLDERVVLSLCEASLEESELTPEQRQLVITLVRGLPERLEVLCSLLNTLTSEARAALFDAARELSVLGREDPLFGAILEGLPAEARVVLIQCSAFAGSFRVADAEEMFEAVSPRFLDMLELLRAQRLVELRAHPQEGWRARLRPQLMSALREHLSNDGESAALAHEAAQRHAEVFARHARGALQRAAGSEEEELLGWVERERAELALAARRLDASAQGRAISQLQVFEALRTGEVPRALELTADWPEVSQEAVAHTGETFVSVLLWIDALSASDQPERAFAMISRQLAHEARSEEERLQLLVRGVELGSTLHGGAEIEAWLREGFTLALGPRLRFERGRLLLVSALLRIHEREWSMAHALCQEAIELFELGGHRREVGRASFHLGHIHKNMGQLDQSLSAYERAWEISMETGQVQALAHIYRERAWLWLDVAELEMAEQELRQLEELVRLQGLSWQSGVAHMLRGQLELQRGQLDRAASSFEGARWHLTRASQPYLLAATLYFSFLTCWASGDLDLAYELFQGAGQLESEISSLMAQVCYGCARAVLAMHHGEEALAREALTEARSCYGRRRATCWLDSLLEVHEFALELHAYTHRKKLSAKHRAELAEQLISRGVPLLLKSQSGNPVTEFNAEVRLCWELVSAQLPEEIAQKIALGMIDPLGEAFILDRAQRQFRAPHSHVWVNLKRREMPYRLLSALVSHRVNHPGASLDVLDLVEHVWAGEQLMIESAQNRLYVTIAALRKEGLRDLIVSATDGYMFDPDVRVIEL